VAGCERGGEYVLGFWSERESARKLEKGRKGTKAILFFVCCKERLVGATASDCDSFFLVGFFLRCKNYKRLALFWEEGVCQCISVRGERGAGESRRVICDL
jgi:hypothetical protein